MLCGVGRQYVLLNILLSDLWRDNCIWFWNNFGLVAHTFDLSNFLFPSLFATEIEIKCRGHVVKLLATLGILWPTNQSRENIYNPLILPLELWFIYLLLSVRNKVGSSYICHKFKPRPWGYFLRIDIILIVTAEVLDVFLIKCSTWQICPQNVHQTWLSDTSMEHLGGKRARYIFPLNRTRTTSSGTCGTSDGRCCTIDTARPGRV